MKIFITGGRSPLARELANCLQSENCKIYIIDVFLPSTLKKIDKNIDLVLCPSPKLNNQDFEIWAIDFINKHKPDLVIPINEEVFYWAKLREKIDFPLISPSFKILTRLHSKFQFNKFIKSIGINAPHTEIAALNMNGKNFIFKREYSRFGENILIQPKFANFPIIKNNPMLAQNYINGQDFSFYSLINNGEILLFSAYKSDWRTKGGAALCFENAENDIAIFAYKIAQKIAYEIKDFAQISCDFRIDKDGKIWLLECNPRATSGLHNLMFDKVAIKNAFLNQIPQNIMPQSAKIGIAMLLIGLPKAIMKMNLKKFIKDYIVSRDVLKNTQLLALKDTILWSIKAKLQGQSLSQFLTNDIEFNGDFDEN